MKGVRFNMEAWNKKLFVFVLRGFVWCFFLQGCSLENNINIDLPPHESNLVVECYLEPGKQVHLLLTETSPYLAPPSLPLVNDALVTITYKNIVDTLILNPQIDEKSKVYNYTSKRVVPQDYENEFLLQIKDSKGRAVRGKTKLLEPVPIQKMEYRFNNDSLAYILVTFSDDVNQKNFYRFVVHKDSLSNVIQRFPLSDELSETSNIAVGTPFVYERGDLAFVTLYHIEKSYYEYLQTVDAARDANFNPFAQPSMIKSNVEGGLGIFTGLSYESKLLVIE